MSDKVDLVIRNSRRITQFTRKEVEEIIPNVTKITTKYMKQREELLDLMKNQSYSANPSKVTLQLYELIEKWKEKIFRLGGRVVSEQGKVRFQGQDCFYFWEFGSNDVNEVYFK